MVQSPSHDLGELVDFAVRLGDAAADAILPHFRSGAAVENKATKSAFDPVTEADRAGERAIRALIAEHYPHHGVRGEELPDHAGTGPFTWVLDPIDGTRAFITGMPVWSTLIGLLHDGAPLLGIMNQPFVEERFVGSPQGAFVENRLGRKALQVRRTTELSEAFIAVTYPGPAISSDTYRRYLALEERTKEARRGGDAYSYCLLAAGHVDLALDARMDDYDIVALIPIIENAGGIVTTWTGESAVGGGNILAAATPELHSAALEILGR